MIRCDEMNLSADENFCNGGAYLMGDVEVCTDLSHDNKFIFKLIVINMPQTLQIIEFEIRVSDIGQRIQSCSFCEERMLCCDHLVSWMIAPFIFIVCQPFFAGGIKISDIPREKGKFLQ